MSPFESWSLPCGAPADAPVRHDPDGDLAILLPGDAFLDGLMRDLRRARREALLERTGSGIVRVLGRVGARFLDPADPIREEALSLLPGQAPTSETMARRILEGMARDWTEERLSRAVRSEFPDPEVLDGFRPGARGPVRALGPELTVHVGAGNVPGVSVGSLIRALLVKSAVLLKPGRGDVALPVLFARALREEDPELARSLAVLYWPGGRAEVEERVLPEADLVVVYGGAEAVSAVRSLIRPTTRLVSYHHRVSFGMLAREVLERSKGAALARRAALATVLFEQRGCVSPHRFYVEEGGELEPEGWAELLAGAMAEIASEYPAGRITAPEAAALHQLRATAELRESAGTGVRVLGENALVGTVILDPDPSFTPSCLARTVHVSPIRDLGEVPSWIAPITPFLQGVALEAGDERRPGLAEVLARAGVSRITGLDALPWPPPWWHHDGSGPLRSLVRWTDLEAP